MVVVLIMIALESLADSVSTVKKRKGGGTGYNELKVSYFRQVKLGNWI